MVSSLMLFTCSSREIGLTYERFYIRMNVDGTPRDVPVSDWGDYIDEIRLLVDGDAKITITADDLVRACIGRRFG